MQTDKTHANFDHVLSVLRRHLPLIVACLFVAAGAAFLVSDHQSKKYTATASLVFTNDQLSQQVAGLQTVGNNNQQAQQVTNLKLVQLGDLARRTATILRGTLTADSVRDSIVVTGQGQSNIVNVSATATSPRLAALIANTYVRTFVSEQVNSNGAYYRSALGLVNRQLAGLSPTQRANATGLALETRAQSLSVLAELRTSSVKIAQTASIPTSPSSPKTTRNTVLGAVLGLLLGLAAAFVLNRTDRRIREPKDLEAIYRLPLLGVVPENGSLGERGEHDADADADVRLSGEAEAFQLIRAHLRYFNVDRDLRTLLVTSAGPGDGKSTVARHLAAAAARMGSRVLLVEADLRRPTVAQSLGIPTGPGLSDVLIGALPLADATQTVTVAQSGPAEGSERKVLEVLVAGVVPPPNPAELIESHAMEIMLEQAASTYDLVVIDTPPLALVSDAFPLLRKVDGVILVGRIGRNRRDVAERLNETLQSTGAPLLGIVANGFKVTRGAYDYGYDASHSYVSA